LSNFSEFRRLLERLRQTTLVKLFARQYVQVQMKYRLSRIGAIVNDQPKRITTPKKLSHLASH